MEPPARRLDVDTASRGVVLELVLRDLADGEIARVRMCEVEPCNGSGRQHRVVLGDRHAGVARAERVEKSGLDRMVGARRIARGGADAAILLAHECRWVELLVARVTPQRRAHAAMHPL